jgi:hypothetical protein
MQKKSSLLILLGCIFLSGCTYTSSLPLHYTLDKADRKVHQVKQSPKVAVNVTDKRGLDDPKSFITSSEPGKLINVTEKPIADIVEKAIDDGLQQMNFETVETNDARYVLNCNINNILSAIRDDGFKFTTTAITKINVFCYLFDKKYHKVIWQDRIISEGQQAAVFNTGNDRRKSFCFALTNLVREIQSSETLRIAVEPHNAE